MHPSLSSWARGPRLAGLVSLIAITGLGGCASKSRPNPPVRAPQWQGLRMGMERARAEKRLRDAGLQVRCAPAQNVTYFDGKDLYTRWIKKAQAGRIVRCTARRKKGVKPGPDGVVQTRLYFLDDRLYRLHVKIISTDKAFKQLLKARFGTLRQQSIARYAYASKKPSTIRMWTLARPPAQLLWLRSAHRQQLVMFTTIPERVKALKALSSSRKGE